MSPTLERNTHPCVLAWLHLTSAHFRCICLSVLSVFCSLTSPARESRWEVQEVHLPPPGKGVVGCGQCVEGPFGRHPPDLARLRDSCHFVLLLSYAPGIKCAPTMYQPPSEAVTSLYSSIREIPECTFPDAEMLRDGKGLGDHKKCGRVGTQGPVAMDTWADQDLCSGPSESQQSSDSGASCTSPHLPKALTLSLFPWK